MSACGMYHWARTSMQGAHCLDIGFCHVFPVPVVLHLLMHASCGRVLE